MLIQRSNEALALRAVNRRDNVLLWMATAFALALGLAVAVLATKGINNESLRLALRLTARLSFMPFWLAYTGSAIASLFGPFFTPIAKRGRDFGLAYAAALTVHLATVLGLFVLTSRPPLTGWGLALFLVGAFFTYLLVVFSFGGLSKTLGAKGWGALRFVAVNYILYAFAVDFIPGAMHASAHNGLAHLINYGFFASMTVAAPFLVLAAAVRRRFGAWRQQVSLHPIVN